MKLLLWDAYKLRDAALINGKRPPRHWSAPNTIIDLVQALEDEVDRNARRLEAKP